LEKVIKNPYAKDNRYTYFVSAATFSFNTSDQSQHTLKKFQAHHSVNTSVTQPLMEVRRSLFNSSTYFPGQPNGHHSTPIIQDNTIPTIQNNIHTEAQNIPTITTTVTDNSLNKSPIDTNPNNTNNNQNTLEHTNETNMQSNDTDNNNYDDTVTLNHTTSPNLINKENSINSSPTNSTNPNNKTSTTTANLDNFLAHPFNHNNGQFTPNYNPIPPPKHTPYAIPVKSIRLQTPVNPNRNLFLPHELESLRPTIMSQHDALENHIKELGALCLNFTTMIQKKKTSSEKLLNNEIIPKSLRIKCELSAAPSYMNHKKFIELKQKLQDEVKTFIQNSTDIMKEWSTINLELLLYDRCNNILQKALNILEGIMSYYSDIINPTSWNSIPHPLIPLLLIKIYFDTNMMPEVQNIILYFNIPKEQILIIASKIITGHSTNHQAQEALESINISLLKKLDDSQSIFINETLNNFHLIIKATTIDLWEINLHSQRLAEANQKFKIKMEQSKLKSATEATAKALHKATESINQQNTADAITQL
jgi:hypothetical protein